jgi:hypothetical protein
MIRNRHRFRWAGVAVVIALLVWAAWLAVKRAPFSLIWEKWKALQRSPTLSSWIVSLGLVVLVLLLLVLWKVPQWQVGRVQRLSSKDRFDRVNEARKTLATILGGILLLLGFLGTWLNIRVAQEALTVSQEGQITDRFTKAIEQLGATDVKTGKPKREVRLGGIYALEGIANDSEEDHWPIMEVLCTYVRENARRKPPTVQEEKGKQTANGNQAAAPPRPSADIQAILTVLGRRDRELAKKEKEEEYLDLHDTDLRGASLQRNFSRANF